MDNVNGSAARTGFLFFVASMIIIAAVYFVGDGGGLFKDYTTYYAYFPSASGLRSDSRVFLSGVPVGTVQSLGFPEDIEEQRIKVTLAIQTKYADRIRVDSIAWIESQGLLGDKQVSILLGSPQKPRLPPGQVIRAEDQSVIEGLIGKKLVSGTSDLLENMIEVLKEVNAGKGTLGQFIKNPELYANLNEFTRSLASTSRDLSAATTDLKGIIDEVRTQQGTLGKLIFSREYAEEFTQAIRNLNRLMRGMGDVVEPIAQGSGTIGKLVRDDKLHGELVETLAKVSSLAGRLDGDFRAMEENRSFLDRLVRDPALGRGIDHMVASLERGAGLLAAILEKIDAGRGTAGLLVNDPSIAVSLQDIFLGVQDSGVLESLVRRAEEEGQTIRLRSERLARESGLREVREVERRDGKAPPGKVVPASSREGDAKPVPDPGAKGGGGDAPAPPAPGPTVPAVPAEPPPGNDGK
jgi:phospholipid/cholesterol/gamma-HCH transport system substrate-binding protein